MCMNVYVHMYVHVCTCMTYIIEVVFKNNVFVAGVYEGLDAITAT